MADRGLDDRTPAARNSRSAARAGESHRWTLDRKAAQDERSGRESDGLLFAIPVLADHLDGLELASTLPGNDQIRELLSK